MCMVHLLIAKEVANSQIVSFLNANRVTVCNHYLYLNNVCATGILDTFLDYQIIGIETENSAKNDFTALGGYDYYLRLRTCLSKNIGGALCRQREERIEALFHEDFKNWFSLFANAFSQLKIHDLGIYYIYPQNAGVPQIGGCRKFKKLTGEDLLKMQANKILFIRK